MAINYLELLEETVKSNGLPNFKLEEFTKQFPSLAASITQVISVAYLKGFDDSESGLRLVEKWREDFQLPIRKKLTLMSDAEFSLCQELIIEESEELFLALSNKDYDEIVDGICDQIFVGVQFLNCMGVDPEEAVKEVFRSNMSKLCTSEQEAIDSVEDYSLKGIGVTYTELTGGRFILNRVSDGKVMKNINWTPPKWTYNERMRRLIGSENLNPVK